MSKLRKAAKLMAAAGAVGAAYTAIKRSMERREKENDEKIREETSQALYKEMLDKQGDSEAPTQPQDIKDAVARLKEVCKGMQKSADRLTGELAELRRVAEAKDGKLPDVNAIAEEILGPCDDVQLDEQQMEEYEKYKRLFFDGTGDDHLDTLRKHWSSTAVMTDDYSADTVEQKVAEENLLPGELSAVTFHIGCYTIRSAQRVYRLNDGVAYIPEEEKPATEEDLEHVRKMGALDFIYHDGLRMTHEISARRKDEPQGNFTYICRAAESMYWCESIEAICSVKENPSIADECASLCVLNTYVGDSFSVDTWYKLDPSREITKLKLHPFNSNIDNVRFQ